MIVTFFRHVRHVSCDDERDLSWEEFARALSSRDVREDKNGPGFSPARFARPCPCCARPGGHRVDIGVVDVSALVLDLDRGEHFTDALLEVEAARVVESVRAARRAALLYTTHSHAPPDRCALRAVFPLDAPVPATEWSQFWRAAVELLGLPADPRSSNPSRFWYLPSCPPSRAPLAEVAVVAGPPLSVEDVRAARPRAVVAVPAPAAVPVVERGATAELLRRARERLARHGPAVQGRGGDQHTFAAAAILSRDFALSDDDAWRLLCEWNATCEPPWDLGDLRRKFTNAGRYATLREEGVERDLVELERYVSETYRPPRRQAVGPGAPVEVLSEMADRVLALADAPFTPTCFPRLDRALGGGLHAGSITVVVAGSGKGKTSFALQVAAHWSLRAPVVYYAAEMDPALHAARVVAQRLGAPWGDVIAGRVPRGDVERALAGLDVRFVRRAGDPAAAVRAALPGSGEPLVVIDYLQVLVDLGEARASVARAINAFRVLAEDSGAALLVLSQTSRAGARLLRDGGLDPEDAAATAAESAAIEQAAANVLAISFAARTDQDDHDVEVTVGKARFRGPSRVGFRFRGSTGAWVDVDEPPAPAAVRERRAAFLAEVLDHEAGRCGCSPGSVLTLRSLGRAPHGLPKNRARLREILDHHLRAGVLVEDRVLGIMTAARVTKNVTGGQF